MMVLHIPMGEIIKAGFNGIKDVKNNNTIERYHNTFREFDKIRRAFKGNEQVLDDGFRVYYNFIKNHEGLNGLTPSQAIGIDMNLGTNKWLNLLRQSLEFKKSLNNKQI